jgi:medium-chain acyl-[acyl-carrier-protein] hydrolase
MSSLQLFCLPYAGGSSAIYHRWKPYIDSSIELIPIELSGRGSRFMRPLYHSIHDAVADIAERILPYTYNSPYAIWGHSMGGLLTYELAHLLRVRGCQMPVHLFISGSSAPDRRKKDKLLHVLPEAEFIQEIKALKGTPNDFFENQELVDLYIPILRSDFKMIEQYNYREPKNILPIRTSILYGSEEKFKDQIKAWERHLEYGCNYYEFQGGHFFIFDYVKETARLFNQTLLINTLIQE